MQVTDEMVSKFLTWPLPKDFGPDCGISFDGRKDDQWNKNKDWPVGTNLLTATQARQMLEHVLAGAESSMVAKMLYAASEAVQAATAPPPGGDWDAGYREGIKICATVVQAATWPSDQEAFDAIAAAAVVHGKELQRRRIEELQIQGRAAGNVWAGLAGEEPGGC